MTRHQYGTSAFVSQTSFRAGETVAGVAKCRLFFQASSIQDFLDFLALSCFLLYKTKEILERIIVTTNSSTIDFAHFLSTETTPAKM